MQPTSGSVPGPVPRRFNPQAFALTLVVGVIAYFSYLNRDYQLDDALIYYRYIRNCLAGNGLVYNVGERFNALTSPLHTYLALVVCGLSGSIRYPMIILSALLTASAACGLYVLYRPHEARWPFVAYGAVMIAASRYFYSLYGMETPLFLTLCVACLWLYERRFTFALGMAAALLVLTRGEGVLLVAAMGVAHLAQRRPLPRPRDLVAPVLLLAGNAAFDLVYYGSPLPHTLMAKLQQGRSGLWGGRWSFFDFTGQLDYFDSSWGLFATAIVLAILGIVRLGRKELNLVVLGFLAALTLFYVGLHVPNYHWYYAPYYAFFSMYVGLGLAEAFELAGGRVSQAVTVILAALVLGRHAYATQTRPVTADSRQQVYPRMGEWLARNTPPDASVAMVEVGIIGYYSERRVVDILGLVTPKNAESLGSGRLDEWLERDNPDFILVHEPLWPHEDGVIGAVRQGRYVVSTAFEFPGFELLSRTGKD